MKLWKTAFITGIAFAAAGLAQDNQPAQQVTVKFHDPAAPKKLEVSLMASRNVTVRGVQRNDVLVDFSGTTERKSRAGAEPPPGMHRIGGGSLSINEDNNVVRISGGIMSGPRDIDIQVPVQTAVTVAMSLSGKVTVSGIAGEIEVNHLNGDITIENASGPVVAHSTNGKIVATLSRLAMGKSMSFSTFNGDIDVTMPADSKATLKARADNGDIFTDFDVKLQPQAVVSSSNSNGPTAQPVPPAPPAPPVPPAGASSSSRDLERQIRDQMREAMRAVERAGKRVHGYGYVEGTVNGGGTDMQFTTFNGRILIHKK